MQNYYPVILPKLPWHIVTDYLLNSSGSFCRGFDKPCCVNQQISEIVLSVCLNKVDFNSAIMKIAMKFSGLHVLASNI